MPFGHGWGWLLAASLCQLCMGPAVGQRVLRFLLMGACPSASPGLSAGPMPALVRVPSLGTGLGPAAAQELPCPWGWPVVGAAWSPGLGQALRDVPTAGGTSAGVR